MISRMLYVRVKVCALNNYEIMLRDEIHEFEIPIGSVRLLVMYLNVFG